MRAAPARHGRAEPRRVGRAARRCVGGGIVAGGRGSCGACGCALVVCCRREDVPDGDFFCTSLFFCLGCVLWSSLTCAACVLDYCVDVGACGDVSTFSLQHPSCHHNGCAPACIGCEQRCRSAFMATQVVLHDCWTTRTCCGPRTTDSRLWFDSGVTLMERHSMTVTQEATYMNLKDSCTPIQASTEAYQPSATNENKASSPPRTRYRPTTTDLFTISTSSRAMRRLQPPSSVTTPLTKSNHQLSPPLRMCAVARPRCATPCARSLVVHHVAGGGRELGVALDDLVDRVQKVLLRHSLAAGADGEHARLGAH